MDGAIPLVGCGKVGSENLQYLKKCVDNTVMVEYNGNC